MTEDKDRPERAAGLPNISEISEDEIDRNLMGTFPAQSSKVVKRMIDSVGPPFRKNEGLAPLEKRSQEPVDR